MLPCNCDKQFTNCPNCRTASEAAAYEDERREKIKAETEKENYEYEHEHE